MLCRKATKADLAPANEIWTEAFGGEAGEAEYYINGFVGLENQFVAEEAGEVIALLSAVPCVYGSWRGAYFFALATKTRCRGRGVMARLMAYAEEACKHAGLHFSCLIPASGSLFGYYEKQGYHTVFLRALCVAAAGLGGLVATYSEKPLEAQALDGLRRHYLPGGALQFEPRPLGYLLEMPAGEGYTLGVTAGAYAVYKKQGQVLALAECMAADETEAKALILALCSARGCQTAALTLPPQSDLFAGRGWLQPAAQVKAFTAEPALQNLYLRFGLDEVFVKEYERLEDFCKHEQGG